MCLVGSVVIVLQLTDGMKRSCPSLKIENYSQRIQKMKLQNKILLDFLSFLIGVILIALAFAKVW